MWWRRVTAGVADDVGHQDRRELASLAHGANAEAGRSPGRGGLSMMRFHAALKEDVESRERSPNVSTDRSIHAV
jgi:hypothetical protein